MEKIFIKNARYLVLAIATGLLWTGCKKENSGFQNPQILSGPDSASAGEVIILEGKDLAEVRSILFEVGNTPANFNPVFNNPNAILFQVPDTAWGGPNKILITNKAGKTFIHSMVVVTPAVIESVSLTDYVADMTVTLRGSNFQDVTEVELVDMSDEPTGLKAQIVSKSKKELVIKMPGSTHPGVKLKITNTSSSVISKMTFVNIDNATPIFVDGYAPKMEIWSWGGGSYSVTNSEMIMGTSGIKLDQRGVAAGSAYRVVNNQLIPFGDHTNVSFWIKGAEVETTYNFYLGDENLTNLEPQLLTVPANKWTYFTFPLQIWRAIGMTKARSVVFQLRGDGKIIYMDNLVFN